MACGAASIDAETVLSVGWLRKLVELQRVSPSNYTECAMRAGQDGEPSETTMPELRWTSHALFEIWNRSLGKEEELTVGHAWGRAGIFTARYAARGESMATLKLLQHLKSFPPPTLLVQILP